MHKRGDERNVVNAWSGGECVLGGGSAEGKCMGMGGGGRNAYGEGGGFKSIVASRQPAWVSYVLNLPL
jgi:hypothetical protein